MSESYDVEALDERGRRRLRAEIDAATGARFHTIGSIGVGMIQPTEHAPRFPLLSLEFHEVGTEDRHVIAVILGPGASGAIREALAKAEGLVAHGEFDETGPVG